MATQVKKVSHQFAKRCNSGVSVGVVVEENPSNSKVLVEFPDIRVHANKPLRVRLYKHTCNLLYGAQWY